MRILVIGAGVAGMTAAYSLTLAGHQVTVLDREPIAGNGASFANGAQLSYSYVAPLAAPGVARKALGWMLDAEAPLRLHARPEPAQWRWLLEFLRCCTAERFEATTVQLLGLGAYSRRMVHRLMQREALDFAWRMNGKLVVYRDAKELAGAAEVVRLQARHGSEQQVLNASQCLALEPALEALRGVLAGGIHTPSEEVGDAHRFCLELQRVLEAQGTQFLFGRKALGLLLAGGQAVGVETMEGPLHADAVVLAGGAAAVHLLRPHGIRLPIYPLRGYSLTLPVEPWHSSPRISITDSHHKIVYASLQDRAGHQLRVAGMVDLAGEDTSQPARRLATLARQAEAAFPAAADWSRAKSWAGLRPATPDGKPIIGPSGIPGLWLNVGHGALGFTLAPATGQILADMISGEEPALDPAPFALVRATTAQSVAATV